MAALAVVMLATTVLAGSAVLAQWRDFRRSEAGIDATRTFGNVLRALEKISVERGPTNGAFGAALAADPDWAQRLARARADTDDAFATMEADLARLGTPVRRDALAHAREVRQRLDRARTDADSLAALPNAGRDPDAIRAIVARLVALALDVAPIVDDAEAAVGNADPALHKIATVARLAAEMREYAGQLGSVFSAPLARRVAFVESESFALERLRGRISALSQQLARAIDVACPPTKATDRGN